MMKNDYLQLHPTSVEEGAESPLLLAPLSEAQSSLLTELAVRVTSVTPTLPLACLDADGDSANNYDDDENIATDDTDDANKKRKNTDDIGNKIR